MDFRLIVYLAYWPDANPGCFPTLGRAAEDLNCSAPTIQRCARTLEDTGYLAPPFPKLRGKLVPRTQYQVTLPAPSLRPTAAEEQLLLFSDLDLPDHRRPGTSEDLITGAWVWSHPAPPIPPLTGREFEKTTNNRGRDESVSQSSFCLLEEKSIYEFIDRADALFGAGHEKKVRLAIAAHGPSLDDGIKAMDHALGVAENYHEPVRSFGLILKIMSEGIVRPKPIVARAPVMQNYNPAPAARGEASPPVKSLSAEEVAALVADARQPGQPGRHGRLVLRVGVANGEIPPELVPAELFCSGPEKNRPREQSANFPRDRSETCSLEACNSTVNSGSRQISGPKSTDQRARKDSNLQPSDSKSARLISETSDVIDPAAQVHPGRAYPLPTSNPKSSPKTKHRGSSARDTLRC